MHHVHRRVGLDDVVHIVAVIPGQRADYWTPMCQPDEDWIILLDSATDRPASCLWCITNNRFR